MRIVGRRGPDRVEEVAAIGPGERLVGNGHDRRPERRRGERLQRLPGQLREDPDLVHGRRSALVVARADRRPALDVLGKAQAEPDRLAQIGERRVSLEVDEVAIAAVAVDRRDEPERLDRAEAFDVARSRADDLDVRQIDPRHERCDPGFVAQATARVAVQLQCWVPAARDGEHVALDPLGVAFEETVGPKPRDRHAGEREIAVRVRDGVAAVDRDAGAFDVARSVARRLRRASTMAATSMPAAAIASAASYAVSLFVKTTARLPGRDARTG